MSDINDDDLPDPPEWRPMSLRPKLVQSGAVGASRPSGALGVKVIRAPQTPLRTRVIDALKGLTP